MRNSPIEISVTLEKPTGQGFKQGERGGRGRINNKSKLLASHVYEWKSTRTTNWCFYIGEKLISKRPARCVGNIQYSRQHYLVFTLNIYALVMN